MPNFRTKITTPKFPFEISHSDKIMSFGSCFSENMGQKLANLKFDISINPYGILFNPLSIFKAVSEIVSQKTYTEKDLKNNKELWFSFNHHSSFAGPDKELSLNKINNSILSNYEYLKHSKVVFFTFGTAWTYRLKETKNTVANCYKLPNTLFDKELLSVQKITEDYSKMMEKVQEINPSIQVVNTISPVRHLKDGFVENQQSKAILILALKEIVEKCESCHYFPSYEIIMDDLRDYRFYEKDMLHPSPTATKYIWNKLENSILSDKSILLNKKIAQIQSAVNHKAFNPKSEETANFKSKVLQDILELEKGFAFLDFMEEKRSLGF